MSDERPQMKQYQDKIKQLNRAQADVMQQLDNPIKFGGPLVRWKSLMRGALKEASDGNNNLVKKFDKEWGGILDDHGVDSVDSMTVLSDKAYDKLVNLIQDWQQDLGMGFSKQREMRDFKEPIRLSKLADKEVNELIEIYQIACKAFSTDDSEVIKKRLRMIKNEN